MAAACDRGLRIQGSGVSCGEAGDLRVVHDVHEIGDEDAEVAGLHALRQLVAEVARGGFAHPRHAQVLAQHGRRLHVEIVQRDDAVEVLGAGNVAHALHQVLAANLPRDVIGVVDRLPRPVRIAQLVERQQQDPAALRLALADEGLALLVSRDAQDGQRTSVGHGVLLGMTAAGRISRAISDGTRDPGFGMRSGRLVRFRHRAASPELR